MFFNTISRTDTSCGLPVSRIARSRSISGTLDLGAAMIRRLADLSGQTRTCEPAVAAAPAPEAAAESPPGDGSPAVGMGAPAGEGAPAGVGPVEGVGFAVEPEPPDCALRMRFKRLPTSAASPCW